MSETLLMQNAEVPFSFEINTTELIGYIQTLSFRTQRVSRELLRLDKENLPSQIEVDLRSDLIRHKESLGFDIAKVRVDLFTDALENQNKLSNEQKIFLDSIFRNLNPSEGIDFAIPNRELALFRQLVPGTKVRFFDLDNKYANPDKPSDVMLSQLPMVSLEFQNSLDAVSNYITVASVTYAFEGVPTPLIKTWLPYNVEIIG